MGLRALVQTLGRGSSRCEKRHQNAPTTGLETESRMKRTASARWATSEKARVGKQQRLIEYANKSKTQTRLPTLLAPVDKHEKEGEEGPVVERG